MGHSDPISAFAGQPTVTAFPWKPARSKRLLRPPEFQRAFRQGSRAKAKFLIVVAVPNQGPTRLGLSVGKRIFKLAHRRNRLKRVLREAFRLEFPTCLRPTTW